MTRNVEYILSLRDRFTKTLNSANVAVNRMERSTSSLQNLTNQLGLALTAYGTLRGIGSVLRLGMDAEQIALSFEVMLGSIEKSKKMISDVKAFAIKTPFLYTEVLENTKQLIAYGFTQDEVLTTMKMLGNVASGLKIPLGDLNYLYGTLKAQGRVMAIDIRQFAMRGIPIYDELAKVLGVAKNKVSQLVTEGKVGFKDVEKAFVNMSASGGKFFNLMDRQSLTAAGKLSNLRDIISQTAERFGEKYLPQVNKAIDAGMRLSTWLSNNTDKIMKVISVVAKAGKLYIIYRASIFATVSALRFATIAHTVFRIAMIAYNRGIQSAIILTKAFNASLKLSLIGIAITGIVLLISKLTSLKNKAKEVKDEFEKYEIPLKRITEIVKSLDKPLKAGAYSNVELQATLDYLQEIYDKTADLGFQYDKITKNATYLSNKAYKEILRAKISAIQKTLEKSGILTTGDIIGTRETNITSAAPRIVNININKLIETQRIETTTLKEGKTQIKQMVIEALLEGLNDTQIMRAS